MPSTYQVLVADLLTCFQFAVQHVLDPLAGFGLWPEVRGRVRVHLASGVGSFDYFPTPPPILAVVAFSRLDVEKLADIQPRWQRIVVLSYPISHVHPFRALSALTPSASNEFVAGSFVRSCGPPLLGL